MFRTISDFLKGEYEHGKDLCRLYAAEALVGGDTDGYFHWKRLAEKYEQEAQKY